MVTINTKRIDSESVSDSGSGTGTFLTVPAPYYYQFTLNVTISGGGGIQSSIELNGVPVDKRNGPFSATYTVRLGAGATLGIVSISGSIGASWSYTGNRYINAGF